MAKANSSFSEVQIARRIKEGRGVDAAVARLLGARELKEGRQGRI